MHAQASDSNALSYRSQEKYNTTKQAGIEGGKANEL
jgi:hypothetical protein